MPTVNLLLGLMNLGCALLSIGLSIPLLRGRVPMNPYYGVRFKKSFASEEDWYALNRYGARRMIGWSVVLLLIGGTAFLAPMEGRPALVLLFAAAPLLYLIPCIETYRYARTR